jgi:POT family proton-dependent oligopeptide transporter
MVIGLITYRLRGDKTLGDVGVAPGSADPAEHRRVKLSTMIGVGVIALLVLLTMTGVIHINAVSLAQKMTYVIVGSALLYFVYLFIGGGLTGEEKKRVIVIILLFFFAAIFWSAFEQAPTSLNLFARDFTNRVVFGWEMPTLWLQAANSVFVIALAPVFAWIWVALGKRGKAPSSIAKFAWGLFFNGVGFVVMVVAANIVIAGGGNVRDLAVGAHRCVRPGGGPRSCRKRDLLSRISRTPDQGAHIGAPLRGWLPTLTLPWPNQQTACILTHGVIYYTQVVEEPRCLP